MMGANFAACYMTLRDPRRVVIGRKATNRRRDGGPSDAYLLRKGDIAREPGKNAPIDLIF